ncbi:MAG: ACT domain-containing protein [Sphingomonas sp.]
MPMSRIVLEVFSALDGVGLTASVATALADDGIPCNMIAAYHHDNVFVPVQMAQKAVEILMDMQRRASSPGT